MTQGRGGDHMRHGRVRDTRHPSVASRIRITLPAGHYQVPTRHRDRRRTEPSRHPPPRTASHPGTRTCWGPGRTSTLQCPRGARGRARGTAYRALPAHTRTILKVVRISRPLDALDFVNRITTANRRLTDDPQTTEHSVERQLPVVAHGRAKPMVRPVRAP